MKLPEQTQQLIDQYLEELKLEPKHHLPPRYCHNIWDAFGDTFEPASWKERRPLVIVGKYVPTPADNIRTQLLILSAREVVPIWHEALSAADMLRDWLFAENVPLEEQILTDVARTVDFPECLLRIAEGVLEGRIEPVYALGECATAEFWLGNFLVTEQEKYPGEAQDVEIASLQALQKSFGDEPFLKGSTNRDRIATHLNIDAPGWAAARAYAGIYENNIWTGESNPQLNLEYWQWWLTEAIPQAWELASQSST